MTKIVKCGDVTIGGNNPLVLIAGPCVIESKRHTLHIAKEIKRITTELDIPFVFKASYDKANRTSIDTYRGPGIEKGLDILKEVKNKIKVPVISDVHQTSEVKLAANVLDIIQIPALLCRQTDIVTSVAKAGKPVNIKKGQFLAPWNMKNVVENVEKAGNKNIMLTESGTLFGYNNLVVDMRSLAIMKRFGYPVIFDASHSVQLIYAKRSSFCGQREFTIPLSRAAVAVGVDALYLEVHDSPGKALCDKLSTFKLDEMPKLLREVKAIDSLVRRVV